MSIYEQWQEGTYKNGSKFQTKLFEICQYASGDTMTKLKRAFPEWFKEQEQIVYDQTKFLTPEKMREVLQDIEDRPHFL